MKISISHLRELWDEKETENDNEEPGGSVSPHLPLDQVAGAGHSARRAHLGEYRQILWVEESWFGEYRQM